MPLTIKGAAAQFVEPAVEVAAGAHIVARPVARQKRGLVECPVGGRR